MKHKLAPSDVRKLCRKAYDEKGGRDSYEAEMKRIRLVKRRLAYHHDEEFLTNIQNDVKSPGTMPPSMARDVLVQNKLIPDCIICLSTVPDAKRFFTSIRDVEPNSF